MRIMRAGGAAALVVGLAIGAAGCGDDGKVTVKDADGNSVTVDKDGDGVKITDDDGNTIGSAGSGDLPSDFPKDDVPLVDGDIGYAGSSDQGDAKVWSVAVTSDEDVDSCFADAVEKLEGAGLTKESDASFGDTKTGSYISSEYRVSITATAADDKCSLVYGVQVNTE